MSGSENNWSSEESEHESDLELQEAFKKGELKPGLNIICDPPRKPIYNVALLVQRLSELKRDLPWVERLDVCTGLAPLAPEMAFELAKHEDDIAKGNKPAKALGLDPTVDDFKRELLFHRQAQAAVTYALPKLKALGIKTKRPDDYFAEMAKSDSHMQKIRERLMRKKEGVERGERIREHRQMRKISKQIQVEATLRKQKEKKEMLDEVKKYRKGLRDDLDFLEPGGSSKKKQGSKLPKGSTKSNKSQLNKKSALRRKHKDTKYGFGGKKRGLKSNTRESSRNLSGPKKKFGGKMKSGKSSGGKGRPGKGKR